jgi:hypothetical protein
VHGQKKAGSENCLLEREKRVGSDVGLGLAEALDAVAGFPLAALFQQVHALEALEDVALNHDTRGALEAFVL